MGATSCLKQVRKVNFLFETEHRLTGSLAAGDSDMITYSGLDG